MHYGQFFSSLTGKPVSALNTLADIEKAAEAALGRQLEFSHVSCPVMTGRATVFPYSLTAPLKDFDANVAAYLRGTGAQTN
jgi:hypothetical protein